MLGRLLERLGIPKKVAMAGLGYAVSVLFAAVRAKWPDVGAHLPDPEWVLGIAGTVIVGHTITDTVRGDKPTLPPFYASEEYSKKAREAGNP